MRFFIQTSIFLSILALTACGFHPVYGVRSTDSAAIATQDYLALVNIANIPNREGQYLRNALIDRFYRHERPAINAYILLVTPLRESFINLDITKTSDATRGQLRMKTTIELRDHITGETLLKQKLHSIVSYNILAGEFATYVSKDNARTNALDDLARQIELQLSLYFKRHLIKSGKVWD